MGAAELAVGLSVAPDEQSVGLASVIPKFDAKMLQRKQFGGEYIRLAMTVPAMLARQIYVLRGQNLLDLPSDDGFLKS